MIAAGAWSNGALTHFGMHLPLRVTQEQVTYFATPHAAEFQPGPVPDLDLDGRPLLLRVPDLRRGRAQGGAGRGRPGGHGPTPGRFEPDQAALERTMDFLGRYIPKALGPIIYTKTCLYTLTPDRDFVVDRLPAIPTWSVGDRRRARLQVRVADRADPVRARDRRAHRAQHRAVPDRPRDPAARESAGELHGLTGVGVRGCGGGDARAGRCRALRAGGIAQGFECALTLPLRASPPPAPGAPIPAAPDHPFQGCCLLLPTRGAAARQRALPMEARASRRQSTIPRRATWPGPAGLAKGASGRTQPPARSPPPERPAATGASPAGPPRSPTKQRGTPRRASLVPRHAAPTPARDSATPRGRTAPTGSPASSTAPA